jgi:hypothetical protein
LFWGIEISPNLRGKIYLKISDEMEFYKIDPWAKSSVTSPWCRGAGVNVFDEFVKRLIKMTFSTLVKHTTRGKIPKDHNIPNGHKMYYINDHKMCQKVPP